MRRPDISALLLTRNSGSYFVSFEPTGVRLLKIAPVYSLHFETCYYSTNPKNMLNAAEDLYEPLVNFVTPIAGVR